MNIVRSVRAPWVALHPTSTRWIVTVVMVLDLAVAIGVAVVRQGLGAVYVLLLGIAIAWAFVLPGMLWLTQAANRLRIPGMRRDVNLSLCASLLVTLALAALLANAAGGQPLAGVVLAALVLCCALLYAILPWILAVFVCLVPPFAPPVLHALGLSGPSHAGFTTWAAPVLGVLAVLALWRWWRLQRRENLVTYYLMRPLVLGLNRSMVRTATRSGSLSTPAMQADPLQLVRQRPDWLQPCADLRRTGPRFPRRSLRVALGGNYLPQRWIRHWPAALAFTLVLAGVAILSAPTAFDGLGGWLAGASHGLAMLGLNVLLVFIAVVVPVGYLQYMQIVWRRPNAELPLLALLPGLGSDGRLKYVTLAAALGKPLLAVAVVWVVIACGVVLVQPGAGATALLLTAPALSAGWLTVSMLSMVGDGLGRVARALFEWTSVTPLLILACLSAGLPPHFPGSVRWLTLAWAVWVVFVGAVGWKVWRRFAQRPHPFLAQAR